MNLQPHSSWSVIDATKIQSYMDCPRAYFFEYILGWRSENPNIHLEFGQAWHLAMETLLVEGYTDTAILHAFEKLTAHYRQFFPELMDDSNHPKTPAMAFKALLEYVMQYQEHDRTDEVLYTEIAGTVTLTDQYNISFKMDSIIQTPLGIKSREHKTGSQLSRQWVDQWSLKMQTGVYNHVLNCLFDPDKVWGVEINGTIFNKTKIQFQRVPARRSLQGMEAWYYNTIAWVHAMQQDIERLLSQSCSASHNTMNAYRMNTESCTKYFGCRYHDFCMAWANPLQCIDDIPYGFIVKYWNPKEEEEKAKHIFNLEGRS